MIHEKYRGHLVTVVLLFLFFVYLVVVDILCLFI